MSTPDAAAAIVRALPPFVTPVGLFVDATAEAGARYHRAGAACSSSSFTDRESPDFCAQFGLPYMKAVRVRPGVDLLQYARDFHGAQALLLDAFQEGLHGGTGATVRLGADPAVAAAADRPLRRPDPDNVGKPSAR